MTLADNDALEGWALETEALLIKELSQATQRYTLLTAGAAGTMGLAVCAPGLWWGSSGATFIVYATSIVLIFLSQATGAGLKGIQVKLLAVSKLIGMRHYASGISWGYMTRKDFYERVERLKQRGISFHEIQEAEDREQHRVRFFTGADF